MESKADQSAALRIRGAGPGKCGISIAILGLILTLAAVVRLDQIVKQNLWLDEYWTLYLATGRGDSIFQLPQNQIIEHPPAVGFAGAPAWWHIWKGINTTSHPPLYHIVLRLWVDVLGAGDWSIRMMSTAFSLGCVALLYIAVLKTSGDKIQALIASGLMALAPIQIVYSQQARPYTMIQFIGLAAAIVLISIEQKGWSWLKLSMLALAVAALALTHYFAVGLIAALAAYSLTRFRGRTRVATVAVIVIAGLIAIAAWAPQGVVALRNYSESGYGRTTGESLIHLVLSVPQRLTLKANLDPLLFEDNGSWPLVIATAVMTYLIPVLILRRRPGLLLWWLWVAVEVGLILLIDIVRHSTILSTTRYVTLAAPGVYAILAVPLPGRIGKLLPWVILFGVMAFTADYLLSGPPNCPNVTIVANLIKQEVKPNDVVIITGDYYVAEDKEPPMTYFVIAHYAGAWNRPVVLATAPLSRQVQLQLQRYRRIWVVGISPDGDTRKVLPGWEVHDVHGPGDSNVLWYVTPGRSGNT
jgi:hypothetical protein